MNPDEVEIPKAPAQNNLFGDDSEEKEEAAEEEKPEADLKDFNLEDTILAAASAQGIEIPDEHPMKQK